MSEGNYILSTLININTSGYDGCFTSMGYIGILEAFEICVIVIYASLLATTVSRMQLFQHILARNESLLVRNADQLLVQDDNYFLVPVADPAGAWYYANAPWSDSAHKQAFHTSFHMSEARKMLRCSCMSAQLAHSPRRL